MSEYQDHKVSVKDIWPGSFVVVPDSEGIKAGVLAQVIKVDLHEERIIVDTIVCSKLSIWADFVGPGGSLYRRNFKETNSLLVVSGQLRPSIPRG